MAPAGTDPQVLRKLQDTILAIANDKTLVGQLAEQGAVPYPGTSEDLARLSAEETRRWKQIIDSARIQLD